MAIKQIPPREESPETKEWNAKTLARYRTDANGNILTTNGRLAVVHRDADGRIISVVDGATARETRTDVTVGANQSKKRTSTTKKTTQGNGNKNKGIVQKTPEQIKQEKMLKASGYVKNRFGDWYKPTLKVDTYGTKKTTTNPPQTPPEKQQPQKTMEQVSGDASIQWVDVRRNQLQGYKPSSNDKEDKVGNEIIGRAYRDNKGKIHKVTGHLRLDANGNVSANSQALGYLSQFNVPLSQSGAATFSQNSAKVDANYNDASWQQKNENVQNTDGFTYSNTENQGKAFNAGNLGTNRVNKTARVNRNAPGNNITTVNSHAYGGALNSVLNLRRR